MKTLISKKPSSHHTKHTSALGNKSKHLNPVDVLAEAGEETVSKKSPGSAARKTPTPPIGAKFALSMLGLTNSQSSQCLFQKAHHHAEPAGSLNNNVSPAKSLKSTNLDNPNDSNASNPKRMSRLMSNEDALSPTDNRNDLNELSGLVKTVRGLEATESKISSRKNNVLLKKLLSEGGNGSGKNVLLESLSNSPKSPYNLFDGADIQPTTTEGLNEVEPAANKLNENGDSTAPGPDTHTTHNPNSRSGGSKKKSSMHGSKLNDDIILRTLLNTSDLEPQLVNLESVFDLNKNNRKSGTKLSSSFANSKKDELFCETQNQPGSGKHNGHSFKSGKQPLEVAYESTPPQKRKKILNSILEKGMRILTLY